jgi:simple sugar transport system permease protein
MTSGTSGLRRLLMSRDLRSALTLNALAVFSGLVVGAILMVVTDDHTLHAWGQIGSHPGQAFSTSWDLIYNAYGSLVAGAFESRYALSETLVSAAPLILSGLAVALAFQSGMFNIGAQGQIIAGAILASLVGVNFAGLNVAIHLPLAILAGFVGGAVAGAIPGVLKARTGAHEVIVTIMLNYIMLNLLIYLLGTSAFRLPHQVNAIGKITVPSARLPHLAGHSVRLNLGIVLALVVAVAAAWLLRRSTLGLRFRMVGANPDAARTAGVNIGAMITLSMVLAGGLAGLAGAVQILGVDTQLNTGYSGILGFTAITVALLGRSTPLGVVLGSLLYGALEAGGLAMQAATRVPLDLVVVIQAVIVFFIAAPALVRDIYRVKATGGGFQAFATGWGG